MPGNKVQCRLYFLQRAFALGWHQLASSHVIRVQQQRTYKPVCTVSCRHCQAILDGRLKETDVCDSFNINKDKIDNCFLYVFVFITTVLLYTHIHKKHYYISLRWRRTLIRP